MTAEEILRRYQDRLYDQGRIPEAEDITLTFALGVNATQIQDLISEESKKPGIGMPEMMAMPRMQMLT